MSDRDGPAGGAGGPFHFGEPHRRYDPLRDEWVLVSPGRTSRPWQGGQEPPIQEEAPAYDPDCYLCPGNRRAGGALNPSYTETFVFPNDFAALRPGTPSMRFSEGLLQAESEAGACRVVCFSPRHDLSLGLMSPSAVRGVIDAWAAQTTELAERYPWVQVFENRGEAMGASNPHPHGQIWAGSALPVTPAREAESQRRHQQREGRALLLDVAAQEADAPRVVERSDHWLAIVPFWAVWPFETLLLPRQPVTTLPELDDARRDDLARVLLALLDHYDGLFGVPFPYSMGWHGAPATNERRDHWTLHAHFYPPLLRTASVRKFMVGYELLAEPQRDITPEEAAERLREARRS